MNRSQNDQISFRPPRRWRNVNHEPIQRSTEVIFLVNIFGGNSSRLSTIKWRWLVISLKLYYQKKWLKWFLTPVHTWRRICTSFEWRRVVWTASRWRVFQIFMMHKICDMENIGNYLQFWYSSSNLHYFFIELINNITDDDN